MEDAARDRFHVPCPADQCHADTRTHQHPSEIVPHGAGAHYRDHRVLAGLREKLTARTKWKVLLPASLRAAAGLISADIGSYRSSGRVARADASSRRTANVRSSRLAQSRRNSFCLTPRMIFLFRVALQLPAVKVYLPQIARSISLCLIVEMPG